MIVYDRTMLLKDQELIKNDSDSKIHTFMINYTYGECTILLIIG